MSTSYKDNILFFDKINLLDFSHENATPFYIYSESLITDNFRAYQKSFGKTDHLICYSVKANSNLSLLALLSKLDSGFDIVSGGELSRVLAAGGKASKVVFSGVGKTDDEIRFALKENIMCFNIESHDELLTINKIAMEEELIANISFRINPAINVETHPYITTGMKNNKFGIEESAIIDFYLEATKLKSINIIGIDFHIGSQILEISPYNDSIDKITAIIKKLKSHNIHLRHIDIGGGLGIGYSNELTVPKDVFIKEVLSKLSPLGLKILIEPGRSIVGEAGLLISKVINIKKSSNKNFVIVDAGMNDLIRPPLYEAVHSIKEVVISKEKKMLLDVVGPICETADFMGKDRNLALSKGDFIAIEDVGAYGSSLSSNYNTRPRVDEYLISYNGNIVSKIKDRETVELLLSNEKKYLK